MNGRMELLFLLLVITSQTYQSESRGWSSGMLESGSGIKNLPVTATAGCLMDIELGNINCPTTQDNASPTTTAALCMNQTVAVEQIKTITIQCTQTVNNPTTVMICPTPSPSFNKNSHLVTPNTVYTTVVYQSDKSRGWSSGMLESGSGIKNLPVTATAGCLMDIELGNISCPTTQDNASPTTTAALCMNQTVAVEQIKIITIQHTQTVNNPTTVTICPTPSPSFNKNSHLVTPNTVYTKRHPACTPSTVTSITCKQPQMVLSDVVQISILITSGVLMCLPISALLIVAYCWVRTRQILKKKRNGPGMDFDHSAQDRGANISAMVAVKLKNNPAYETQMPLQENVVHENTILTTTKPEGTQVLTDSTEPAYEIIPLISVHPASTTTNILNNGEGDEYDRLNRDTLQKKLCSQ